MNPVVTEWVRKAQADWRVAQREMTAQDERSFDAVCFHVQQAIEKLLKAVLLDRAVQPEHTHDLVRLSGAVTRAVPSWSADTAALKALTTIGAASRYPGQDADETIAAHMLAIGEDLRTRLLALLPDTRAPHAAQPPLPFQPPP